MSKKKNGVDVNTTPETKGPIMNPIIEDRTNTAGEVKQVVVGATLTDSLTVKVKDAKGKDEEITVAAGNYPAFRMFEPGGRGKASKNAPCLVAFERIDFDQLSADQKAELVNKLIRETARNEYEKRSKGFEAFQQYTASVVEMLKGFGIENPDNEQIRRAAEVLAKKDGLELAFEPVTEMFLTTRDILEDSDAETESTDAK